MIRFALLHELDVFPVLLFNRAGHNRARGSFRPRFRGYIGFGACDYVGVFDEIGKDVAVHAVGCGGVEGLFAHACVGVEGVEALDAEVGGDDDVETFEVGGGQAEDVAGFDVDHDAGVELLDGCCCCCGALRWRVLDLS